MLCVNQFMYQTLLLIIMQVAREYRLLSLDQECLSLNLAFKHSNEPDMTRLFKQLDELRCKRECSIFFLSPTWRIFEVLLHERIFVNISPFDKKFVFLIKKHANWSIMLILSHVNKVEKAFLRSKEYILLR